MEIDKKRLEEAINQVASTEEGKILLAAIKQECGWESVIFDSDPAKMHFHAGKRAVYVALRTFIRNEYLKEVEFNYTIKQVKDGRDDKPDTTVKRSDRKPR